MFQVSEVSRLCNARFILADSAQAEMPACDTCDSVSVTDSARVTDPLWVGWLLFCLVYPPEINPGLIYVVPLFLTHRSLLPTCRLFGDMLLRVGLR